MAYDKARKDEIDAMSVGDLIHTMLAEFDPEHRRDGDEPGQSYMHGNAYLWALERLNKPLPSLEMSGATTEPRQVATIQSSDPFDEREGPWFSNADLKALAALPAGTKLFVISGGGSNG